MANLGLAERARGDRPGGLFDDVIEGTDTPNFDGGARIHYNAPLLTPGEARLANANNGLFGPFPSDELGWVEYEIEDGADLFFGQLGEE
jgi:hypothetical protein